MSRLARPMLQDPDSDAITPRYFVPAIAFLVESGLTPFEIVLLVNQ